MFKTTIEIPKGKIKELNRIFAGFPRTMGRIMSRGINNTLSPIKTQITNDIANEAQISKSYARKRLKLRKATIKNWYGEVYARHADRPIPLAAFKVKQDDVGVQYQITKTGKKGIIQSAFIAKRKRWKGVWKRVGRAKMYDLSVEQAQGFSAKGLKRLPIGLIHGPKITELMEDLPGTIQKAVDRHGGRLVKNIDTQVELALKGKMKVKAG